MHMSTGIAGPPNTPIAPPAPPRRMTEDEFLALPDDGIERWLIDGEVREYGMTTRNFFHSHATIRVGRFLDTWLDKQPEPRGALIGGEAGVRLSSGRIVGVDVAYVSAGLKVTRASKRTIVEGIPTLVVEILSPSDKKENVTEKLGTYSEAAVPVIWKLDPDDRTVIVYRPGQPPSFFNDAQELVGDPELPGFRVRVADLFGR
jgi:Uma2 family endonuclease